MVDQCVDIEILPRVQAYCADDDQCTLRDEEGMPLAGVVEKLMILFVEDLLNCLRTRTRFKQVEFDDVREQLTERLRDYLLNFVAGDENVGKTEIDKLRERFDSLQEIIVSGVLPSLERVGKTFAPNQAELVRYTKKNGDGEVHLIYNEYKEAIDNYTNGRNEFGYADNFEPIKFDERTMEQVNAARKSRRKKKLGARAQTNVVINKKLILYYISVLTEIVNLSDKIGELQDILDAEAGEPDE